MKIVLLKSVDNLGQAGEEVAVKRGYFRNFLEPRGYALTATERNVKFVQSRRRKLESLVAAETESAEKIKAQLEGAKLVFQLRAGEKGQLFGSVTPHDIVSRVKADFNIEVERRKVEAPHIKTLGDHAVRIRIYPGVAATINVFVEPLEAEEVVTTDDDDMALGLEAVLKEQEDARRAKQTKAAAEAAEVAEAEAPAAETEEAPVE
ncbi:MAG: 50S ribosomal protein L9 [Candidatus Sumerlaeia bacterium]|nr:50S ribosomal protein L9 [Candidatus Sumerlaeia bacterium]